MAKRGGKQTQFKKGESGNPNGRPKKMPELKEVLEKVMLDESKGITAVEAIILRLRQLAIGGNLKAIEMLMDRLYGKSKEIKDINLDAKISTPIIEFTNGKKNKGT